MTAAPQPAGRFVLAPVVDGAAAWDRATDLVLAPIRLSTPVHVAPPARRAVSDR